MIVAGKLAEYRDKGAGDRAADHQLVHELRDAGGNLERVHRAAHTEQGGDDGLAHKSQQPAQDVPAGDEEGGSGNPPSGGLGHGSRRRRSIMSLVERPPSSGTKATRTPRASSVAASGNSRPPVVGL